MVDKELDDIVERAEALVRGGDAVKSGGEPTFQKSEWSDDKVAAAAFRRHRRPQLQLATVGGIRST